MNNLKLETLLGAVIGGVVVRCIVIGTLDNVSNKVLIKREDNGRIFAITPTLITWINEG